MTAITHITRACALAHRDTLYVGAITGLTLAAASALLLHYGSLARMLAAIGLTSAI
jgi:hypothetical protein